MMNHHDRFTYGRPTIPQFTKKQNLFDQYLQIFENPTIIYKALRVRHKLLPLFLTRNLSYMHGRSKRLRKIARKSFSVDNILNQVLSKKNVESIVRDAYIMVSAIEICSPSAHGFESASVQVYLLNCGVQKVTSSYINSSDKIYVGSCVNVPIVKSFHNQATVVSITLALQIAKFYKDVFQSKEWTFCFEIVKAKEKFVCLLPIISTSHCYNLISGVYEIPLCTAANFKQAPCDSTEATSGLCVLKVQLAWAKEPKPIAAITKEELIQPFVQHPKENDSEEKSVMETDEEVPQIQYTFVWGPKNENQSISLQLASVCPWCNLTCSQLYSMLKHLCVCHSRFNFVYKPRESSASHIVVEVTLNVRYDGSYEGNAWNLLAQPNQVFEDPQNRSSITELLVWRKIPQPPPSFNEFLPTKKPAVQQRPNKIGHNRVYFHFGTWLPYISPKEMETESDNEGLDWHPENSRREMNDFTDVNEGEKVVMNEWNTFVSVKFKILAVNQVVPACRMFIQQCGPSLLKQKLYRNVVLHFVCLHDFGILSATDLYPLILELQQLASTISDLKHESADAMEIDSMFDKENQLHPQSPSTKEWRKPRVTEDFNQKMTDAEDLNQVALMPNTAHATNKKDAIQSWVTAYQHWLSKNKEL